jgi:16S rRNA (adenine1518-N6/adenine1519-N6)-dimethyltransferase
MNLVQRAASLMRAHRVLPKKRLGQNFMVDRHFLRLMCESAAISRTDVVLEVGAGLGFLTGFLAQRAKQVVAVETDTRLFKILQEELADLDNVELIEGDILRLEVPDFNKMVSNPPFAISSPLLFWLFNRPFDCAVLTFQEEFAKRLNAEPGSKEYSRLTVSAYYRAEVELLAPVPACAFYPPPEVKAAAVRLKPRSPPFQVVDEKVFHEVVRTLFTQRNKLVRNAAVSLIRKYGLRGSLSIGRADSLSLGRKRVRELEPEDFGVLADEFST